MSRSMFDADDDLDPGFEGLRQARLPAAGFVRLVENPTPRFDMPRPQVNYEAKRHGACEYCHTYSILWVWSGCCDRCTRKVFR